MKTQKLDNMRAKQLGDRILAALGDTPDTNAQALSERRVTGVRKMAGDSPIANYFKSMCGEKVSVTTKTLNQRVIVVLNNKKDKLHLPLARHHMKFLERFDKGRYPGLERGGGRN